MTPKKIFISYKQKQENQLSHLINAIKTIDPDSHSYVLMYDSEKLSPGDSPEQQIIQWIKEADLIIVLFSSLYTDKNISKFIHEVELPNIKQRYEEERFTNIMPILLNHCTWKEHLPSEKLTVFPIGHKDSLDYYNQEELSDFWNKTFIQKVKDCFKSQNSNTYTPEKVLNKYLQSVLEIYDVIELSESIGKTININDLFTPPKFVLENEYILIETEDNDSASNWQNKLKENKELNRYNSEYKNKKPVREYLGDFMLRFNFLVLKGDPGMGKTQLTNWLAISYANKYLGKKKIINHSDTLPEKYLIPILVKCRDLFKESVNWTIEQLLKNAFKNVHLLDEEIKVLYLFIEEKMLIGEVLIIFDALDEIEAQEDDKASFRECINRLALK